MIIRRPFVLLSTLALLAVSAAAQDGGTPPAPPPAAPAEETPTAAGETAAPALRIDEKAMELVRKADKVLHFIRNSKVDAISGTVVIPESQIGRLAVDFTWARGENGGEGTVEMKVNASIDASIAPILEQQVFPQIGPLLDNLFIGRRLEEIFAKCHMDYRKTEAGGAEVVITWVDGPTKGQTETLTFDAESGYQTSQVTKKEDGTVVSTSRRSYEKYGERWRIVSATREIPTPLGAPAVIEMKMEWLDCGGVAMPWRMVQKLPMRGEMEIFLEAIVVSGKPYPTPYEEKARKAAETPPAQEAPPAPAKPDGQ